jgi:hypothetical protein
VFAEERPRSRECWINKTRELLGKELPGVRGRLLEYLLLFLGRFEHRHGCGAGLPGIFAPLLLPHVPPATLLMRDLLVDAALIYPDSNSR